MMCLLITGFLLGLSIPVIASRFGKILPADPGLICATLWHKPHFPKAKTQAYQVKLKQKWMKMLYFSLGWGVVLSGLFVLADIFFQPEMLIWSCLFFYIVGLLMAVDHQYYLLPDFFTIPLLLLGITVAYFVPDSHLSFGEKLFGAWFGYLLSTVSVFVMSFIKKGEFGAGDVKMLTELGAWFGMIALNLTLVLSFVIFAVTVFCKKKQADAFGPALGIAGILVFFLVYANLLWTFL